LASQIKVVRIRLRRGRTLTTGTVAAAERFGQQSGESFEIKVYDAPVVHGSPKVALGKLFKIQRLNNSDSHQRFSGEDPLLRVVERGIGGGLTCFPPRPLSFTIVYEDTKDGMWGLP
jgi:hypothetical protein